MSAINHLTLRSTLVYTTPGSLPPPGAFMTTDANGLQVATNNVKVNTGTYSTLTGSTITTSSIVTPAIVGTVALGQNASYPNRYVELGTDLANSMYLDFHSHDTQLPDYSTRIQSLGGGTTGTGIMNLYGSTIGIMGTAGVGIGKTNPAYALDVAGTVNISGSYYVNGAPMSSSQWTTSGSIIYYNSGNVGIGIANPGNLVDIQGATRSGTHATGRPLYITGDIADASAGVEIRHTNGTQGVGIGFNSLYACGSNANQSINLMPKGTGSVGIGTFSPAYGLDIYSNNISLTASSYTTPYVRLQSQYSACYLSVGSVLGLNSYIGLQSGVATSSALGTPPFVVTNANTVGVNTTNPAYTFDVTGYARATSGLLAGNGTGAVSLQLFDLPAASWQITTGGYNLSINNNSSSWTNRVTILQSGYVGIGTTNPSWKCHIYGTGGADAGILVRSITAGDNYSMLGLGNDYYSAGGYLFFNSSTRTGDGGANCLTLRNDVGDLRLHAKGAAGIIVKGTTCYVGIGTITPSCTFEVSGIANIKGSVGYAVPSGFMASGSLTIGDTLQNYGGAVNSAWSSNTAGLLMECLNATEIAVHDAGERVCSFMYYSGNNFTLGRNMGWGASSISTASTLTINNLGYVSNGDASRIRYGPNSTWGAYLHVGAGTNTIASLQSQVITTNGNLHLDSSSDAGRAIYLNYYANQAGVSPEILMYGRVTSGGTFTASSTFTASGTTYLNGDTYSGTVYATNWFRLSGDCGLYSQTYGYGIWPAQSGGNSYGCMTTYGGRSGWSGWGLNAKACLMINGNEFGLHDNTYSWAVNCNGGSDRRVTIGGSVQCSQGWDRIMAFANGYDTTGGYMYYNQAGGFGYSSDERIKKNIEPTPTDKSIVFIQGIQPSFFCLKDEPRKGLHKTADGEITECDVAVCNCPQSGFIGQNVLESAINSGIPKSVCNNWYEYEQELEKPDEERKTLLGVSIMPIVSHTVNVVKHLMDQIEQLKAQVATLTQIIQAQH